MSIVTKLQNILDSAEADVDFKIEVDDITYDVSKIKVTYEDDEPVEVVLVADYD